MGTALQLAAIEDIKRLKARYFRFVDTKNWGQLETVFAPDVKFDRSTGGATVSGREAVMRMVRLATEHLHTVHHGFMPEIEILTQTTARGVWAMCDELWDKDWKLISRGSGHYHETYERLDTGWAIKTAKLTRLSLVFGEGRRPE